MVEQLPVRKLRGHEHDGHRDEESERGGCVDCVALDGESAVWHHGGGGEGGGTDQGDDGLTSSLSISIRIKGMG